MTRFYLRIAFKIGKFLALAFLAIACFNAAAYADLLIYSDSLSAGWDNWSWDTSLNFSSTSPVHSGGSSMAVTYNAAWAGLYLHAGTAVDLSSYESLSFWIHGGSSGNQRLQVIANGDGGSVYQVTAQANTWTHANIPLSSLGSPATLSALYWQDTTNGPQPTFYLDDIALISRTGPPPPPPPPGIGPTISINANVGRHQISEGIYGMNYADEQLAAELRLPVRRWGGNSTSRYNWQIDTSNTGSDWYFENIPEDNPNPSLLPNESAADRFVEQDRRTGTRTLMTVPMMGWVAKRRLENHPYDCGFKVSVYGPQIPPNPWTAAVDPWDTDCGSGVKSGGVNITGNNPAETSMTVGPDFVTSWLNHIVSKYGSAAAGGTAYYALDNEPMLWNSTHRDVHPQPTTYDELRDRTYQYAAAIKSVDPSAQVIGPVLWGWCAYFYSALDGCSIGSDYQSHGNTPFVAWYLQQMKLYEQQHSRRILDYLDLHYYPAANGVSLSEAGTPATQAIRLRSTRSLWDPTYIDESWISDLAQGGIAVRLIPRMKDWVNNNYPGTKLAITEYNWGGLESINGALAQADVLGIFGREGLDIATLWDLPGTAQPGAFAFRMYRNYDSAGHGFGDMSVQTISGDQSVLSAYAATRSMDRAMTLIVINKTANSLTSTINLSGYTPTNRASVYRYSVSDLSSITHLTDQQIDAGSFSTTFPGNSITLFVMMPKTANSGADFNGDGKQDLAVFRPSDGNWYIMSSSSGTVNIKKWGTNGDIPVAGDYDGDGKTDIAVFRPSEGNWYVVNSSTGSFSMRNWGIGTDVPVPGDYDGDGKTDIAVFRPAEGNWYIMNSSTGSFSVKRWGTSGDIPVPGDYDGDGKTDIAVFRPAEGNWYIINSSDNSSTISHWGIATDSPVH